MNPPDSSGAPLRSTKRPNRRRKRSESDRKKHAGWRSCPRCSKSVSTNGRNFYHHMHKCDPVFFADLIARVDMKRTQTHPTPLPSPHPMAMHVSPPLPSPTAPVPTPVPAHSVRGSLTESQHVIFLQQLCFLRTYDSTVDAVFRRMESNPTAAWGIFSTAIFEQIRRAKRDQMRYIAPAVPSNPPLSSNPDTGARLQSPPNPAPPTKPHVAAVVVATAAAATAAVAPTPATSSSPLSPHSPAPIASSRPATAAPPHILPPSAMQPPQTRPPSTMSISSVINN